MSSVSDAQGCRVGVDAISDHAVINRPACGDPVAGQQTHYARVTMVELDHSRHRRITESVKPTGLNRNGLRDEQQLGLTGSMALNR